MIERIEWIERQPRRALGSALCLPALALLLAGACGPSTPSGANAADSPKIDACELFTMEDAAAVAGESVSGMSSTLEDAKGRDLLSCAYNAGNTNQPRILSLVVRVHPSAEAAASTLEATQSALSPMVRGDVRSVPGLGDGAVWAGGSLQQLHVRKGDKQLLITAQIGDGAIAFEAAKKIAERVLARL